jgi:NADH-quinone oxidoreductase subunit N
MFPIIDWNLFSLELLMTATLVVLVVIDILQPKESKIDWVGRVSFMSIFALIAFWFFKGNVNGTTFGGMFVADSLSWFFKGFFLMAMVFILTMTKQYFNSITDRRNIFYLLLWLALLGACLLASSADFLVLFINLEILTISLYVMTAYLKSDKHSIEAGMKYLILGALSSGFLLFGISFIYGVTHSTRFETIQGYVISHGMDPIMLFSMVLVFSAIGFKIACVPFQMWVPDVYQGAPTPVTAVLSVISKAAGFVILIRLFFGVFSAWHGQWATVLAVLSAITMCYGNLAAMFQTNIKRMLGYSSIGHAGYLLMGAAAGTSLGAAAINFYLLGYLFTNLAAFLVIVLFALATKSDELRDYEGLSKRSGFLAAVLLLSLISLAGVPLVGFFGKFTLLMAAIKSDLIWLALVAAVNIVISFYYYLNVVKKIYVDSPRETSTIVVSKPVQLILWLGIAGMLGIGIFQGPFLDAAITAVHGMSFTTRFISLPF